MKNKFFIGLISLFLILTELSVMCIDNEPYYRYYPIVGFLALVIFELTKEDKDV